MAKYTQSVILNTINLDIDNREYKISNKYNGNQ